jgi:hypothetical protein
MLARPESAADRRGPGGGGREAAERAKESVVPVNNHRAGSSACLSQIQNSNGLESLDLISGCILSLLLRCIYHGIPAVQLIQV